MSGFSWTGYEPVYSGHVIEVGRATVVTPDGTEVNRDVVKHPGAVSVVALDANDQVLFERQYRAALDRVILEIPAGKLDVVGEPPEQTARRELIEETGFSAKEWTFLGSFFNSPGFTNEFSSVYLATELTEVGSDLQGPEEHAMELIWVPLASVPDLIASGELVDGKSLIGVLLTMRLLGR